MPACMAASTRPVHSGFPFPLSHRPRPAPNTHVRTPVGSADVSTPSGDAVVHNCSTSFAHFTRRPPRCRAQPAGRRTGEPSTLTEVLATELRRGRPPRRGPPRRRRPRWLARRRTASARWDAPARRRCRCRHRPPARTWLVRSWLPSRAGVADVGLVRALALRGRHRTDLTSARRGSRHANRHAT